MKSLNIVRIVLAVGFALAAAVTAVTVVNSQPAAACDAGVNC